MSRVWCSEDIQCKLGVSHPVKEQTPSVMPTITSQHPAFSPTNKTLTTTTDKTLQKKVETKVQLPQQTNHGLSAKKYKTAGDWSGQEIHVMISSSKETLGGMMALINSIIKNTNATVTFHLVTDSNSVSHIETWINSSTELRDIKREVAVFDSSMIEANITVRRTRKALGSPVCSKNSAVIVDPLSFQLTFVV